MSYESKEDEKAEALILELVTIGIGVDNEPMFNPDATSGFLTTCRARAKAIGQELHALGDGTINLMQTAHARVRMELGATAAIELAFCWDAIGDAQPGCEVWLC